MWPGIPTGKGSTCIEEGCGSERRAGGWECRPCYKLKWKQDRRARGLTGDGAGGYEVPMTQSVIREMDAGAFAEWQRSRDEYT